VSRYQKGKTNLDFAEARDSEWQGHQLDRMQVCTSVQTDNHVSTPPLTVLIRQGTKNKKYNTNKWQYLILSMEEILSTIAELESEHIRLLCVVCRG